MKLLSVLLVIILSAYAFAEDSFLIKHTGCSDQTLNLNQCAQWCGKGYYKVSSTGVSNTFTFDGYTDNTCNTKTDSVGYPIACFNGQEVPFDITGMVTCNLPSESSGNSLTQSISIAVLFAAALILSLM